MKAGVRMTRADVSESVVSSPVCSPHVRVAGPTHYKYKE